MTNFDPSPILIFCEAISYGHKARALIMARWLKPLGRKLIVACPENSSYMYTEDGFETVKLDIAEPTKIYSRLCQGRAMYVTEEVLNYYRQDDQLIADIKPCLIVSEFRFTAQQLAAKYGIPCVSIIETTTHPNFEPDLSLPDPYAKPTFIPIEILDFFSQKTPIGRIVKGFAEADLSQPMRQASKAYGLEVLPKYYDYLANADLCLLCDHPAMIPVHPLRPQDIYVGAMLLESSEPLPSELSKLDPNKKTVYLCPGTQGSLKTDFAEPYINLLLKAGIQVILSRGKRQFDISFNHPNLLVFDFINESKLLSQVDLVVYPGGLMTTYQSLYSGVPLMAIPAHANQLFCAQSIKRNHLGYYIRPSRLKVEKLMELTLDLLDNQNVKANVKSMQHQLTIFNGSQVAISRIKSLLN